MYSSMFTATAKYAHQKKDRAWTGPDGDVKGLLNGSAFRVGRAQTRAWGHLGSNPPPALT